MKETLRTLDSFNKLLASHNGVGIVKPEDKSPSCVIEPKKNIREFMKCLENLITEDAAIDKAIIRKAEAFDSGYEIDFTVGMHDGHDTWPVKYTLYFATKY